MGNRRLATAGNMNMKVTYDPNVDVLKFCSAMRRSKRATRTSRGVIIDYDQDGNIVGLEVLNASLRVPRGVRNTR